MKTKSFVLLCLVTSLLNAKETLTLQELTVTAQKYEEKHIDVPISMNIIDEFDIEDKNIDDFNDLNNLSSNFSIFDAGGSGIVSSSIRGITSDTLVESASIGIYVDGIPYIGTIGNEIPIHNIQRIEILKGPQSTLYGKNSYSGAINIITKAPQNNTNGFVSVGFAEDNKQEYSLNLNTPIIDNKLLLNVFMRHYKKDGFIKNTTLNNEENYKENNYFKSYLKYLVNNKLTISLISSLLKTDDGAPSWNSTASPNLREVASNEQGTKELTNQSHALNIDYELNGFKLSSLTTIKDIDENFFYDGDLSSSPMYAFTTDTKNKEYTQEFRLAKRTNQNNYMLGIYFDDMDKHRSVKGNGAVFQKFGVKSKTISIFTNNDFKLNKDYTVSLGARLDKDKIEMNDELINFNDSHSYTNLSPKISLKYKPKANFMSYATISKGYKSGNYYGFAPTPEQRWYEKESLINYEVGFKYDYSDKLNFALSIFHMDIKDKQVNTNISYNVGVINNAASSESQGIEFDMNYRPMEGLSLYSSLGFNKTEFKKFSDINGNYQGNRNPASPKYTYSLGAKYRTNNGIFTNVNIKGQSNIYADKENLIETDPFNLINFKLGYERENYEVYLYAENFTDKKHDINWGTFSYLSVPREIGIKFKYRF